MTQDTINIGKKGVCLVLAHQPAHISDLFFSMVISPKLKRYKGHNEYAQKFHGPNLDGEKSMKRVRRRQTYHKFTF
jgi:hypothetical protein